MQALRCATSGTRANSSGEKDTFTHQHVPTGVPLCLAASMAQPLGWPHSGHKQGEMGSLWQDMQQVYAQALWRRPKTQAK
jgi:hypothetical protein